MNNSSSVDGLLEALCVRISTMRPGERLPSNRALVAEHHVSASTVSAALAALVQRGVIETQPGVGAFKARAATPTRPRDTAWQSTALDVGVGVLDAAGDDAATPFVYSRRYDASRLRRTLVRQSGDVIDLNSGYLHASLQPTALLERSFARAAKHADAWVRPPLAGLPELRSWFANDLGGDLGVDDVTIAAGGQAALGTLLRALAQPGEPVIVESPCYPGTVAAAHAAGLRAVGVPLDGEGIDVALLSDALRRTGGRVVVVQPNVQNPTTVSMSPTRRRDVVAVAREHGAFVIEDDFARFLAHSDARHEAPAMVTEDGDGVVVHVRSLTKATSPNVRIAAVVSRGPVTTRLREAFTVETMLVPTPLQLVALEAVTGAGWRRAQAALRSELRARRVAASAALREVFGPQALALEPRGGYHLWVQLPQDIDPRDAVAAGLRAGVAVTSGDGYYTGTPATPHLRISYVAAPSAVDVVEGIRRLR